MPSRALLRRLLLSLAFVAGWGSLPVAAQPRPAEAAPLQPARGDRIERITTEDALTRIDELRVDGQTQSIDVQPKNGAPAYQIQPQGSASTPGETAGKPTGNAGRSSWRILNF